MDVTMQEASLEQLSQSSQSGTTDSQHHTSRRPSAFHFKDLMMSLGGTMEYAIDYRKLDRNLQDLSVGLDSKGNPAFDITLKKMQQTKAKLGDYVKQFEPMLEKYLETHVPAGAPVGEAPVDDALKAEVTELKSEIEQLKAENAQMKADNEQMKKDIAELRGDFATLSNLCVTRHGK